jgi:hypothetical protein
LKLPLVPRAGDKAVGDEAFVHRCAAMGTKIIDGEEAVGGAEKADLSVILLDAKAGADRDVFQFQGGIEERHARVTLDCCHARASGNLRR